MGLLVKRADDFIPVEVVFYEQWFSALAIVLLAPKGFPYKYVKFYTNLE
jgi:hypothetical protein